MKYAVHRWTSKTVDADEASYGESYRCPVCSAPVTLRAGGERIAYFAHKPGAGTKDCELYHLGTPTHSAHDDTGSQFSVWEMVLHVTLAKTGFPRHWGLELIIPFKEGCKGELEVDVGGRIQTVTFTDARREKRITAEPGAVSYTVVSTRIADRWRESTLVKKCAGLNLLKATAFGEASRVAGKPIPRAQTIQRGGAYVFLWNVTLVPSFPAELIVERLGSTDDWLAALVDIPEDVSKACCDWLSNFCNLPVAEKSPAFIPVWPPLVSRIGMQLAVVSKNSTLYIGIECLPQKLKSRAIFYARSGLHDNALSVTPADTQFIKVCTESESEFQVSCRDATELRLELDCSLEVDKLSGISGVTLTASAVDGTITTTQLHDQASTDWLERVSAGELRLTHIDAPSYYVGAVRTAKSSAWRTIVELAISPSDGVMDRPRSWAHFVPVIAKILADRSVDIQIDFGHLGRAWLPARRSEIGVAALSLGTALRSRILSYFRQMPQSSSALLVNKAATDQQLIIAAYASKPLPATMSFHRAILNEIKLLKVKGNAK